MKPGIAVAMSLLACCAMTFTAQAAPPEGKGPGHSAGNHGNSGHGNSGKSHANHGNSGKGGPSARGNSGKGSQAARGSAKGSDHRYDDRGRYYDYFDDHRDSRGHLSGDDVLGDLVYAGITAALAHEYALDYDLRGYSSLPPGIRKNLARGKPLPPGIAKKMVPDAFLGRLPRHSGYEWRIAGTDLILVSLATAVVADILYDVFD